MANLPGPQPAPAPRRGLDRLIGLESVKEQARPLIDRCRTKGKLFPSAMLVGPPGIGRRSFAQAVAEELGYPFVAGERGIANQPGELEKLIKNAVGSTKRNGKPLLLFLDMSGATAPAQDLVGRLVVRTQRMARRRRTPLIPMTVFVASPRIDSLCPLFVQLFRHRWRFERYGVEDLRKIATARFTDKGLWSRYEASQLIAQRSQGIAGRVVEICDKTAEFVRRLRDNTVFLDHAHQALHQAGIDAAGLSEVHRECLLVLLGAGHDGSDLASLAAGLLLPVELLVEQIEPALVWLEFISIPSDGRRRLTDRGHLHLAQEALL